MSIPMPDWDQLMGEGWRIKFAGPRMLDLTDLQRVHLHKYLLQLMEQNGYTDYDIMKALNCSQPMVKKITGRLGNDRLMGPSFKFMKKIALFCLGNPEPKTVWNPLLVPPSEYTIKIDKILIRPTQCLECLHEVSLGKRSWEDTWWVKNPKSNFCTPQHKTRWHKRNTRARQINKRYERAEQELNVLYGKTPSPPEPKSYPYHSKKQTDTNRQGMAVSRDKRMGSD